MTTFTLPDLVQHLEEVSDDHIEEWYYSHGDRLRLKLKWARRGDEVLDATDAARLLGYDCARALFPGEKYPLSGVLVHCYESQYEMKLDVEGRLTA
jgi:hypothetical protein